MLKLAFEGNIICLLPGYAPHSVLTVQEKIVFYDISLSISVGI